MKNVWVIIMLVATISQAVANPLYKSCQGCHGAQGERKAMGRSAIIADMNQTQIVEALQGYQEGTYGKSMKGLMKAQVMRLDTQAIQSLASYISAFKTQK